MDVQELCSESDDISKAEIPSGPLGDMIRQGISSRRGILKFSWIIFLPSLTDGF